MVGLIGFILLAVHGLVNPTHAVTGDMRVNCGGDSVIDADGLLWVGDRQSAVQDGVLLFPPGGFDVAPADYTSFTPTLNASESRFAAILQTERSSRAALGPLQYVAHTPLTRSHMYTRTHEHTHACPPTSTHACSAHFLHLRMKPSLLWKQRIDESDSHSVAVIPSARHPL